MLANSFTFISSYMKAHSAGNDGEAYKQNHKDKILIVTYRNRRLPELARQTVVGKGLNARKPGNCSQ